ncbi:hypothetical protein ILUMI_12173 [Ignelater luminosus]|uniref:Uncharacterized protein n=1 Tax=Ignelater luminosus TaxID=2038154 RepID=A0A8K0D033_IGNLU|nr:hypothetical protein ILUMI_12173 [Ignelater luminosus]
MDNNIKLKIQNPKQFANIFSQLTFVWLIKLCCKSVKEGLKIQDLVEILASDKSSELGDTLEKFWNEQLKIAKEKSVQPSLLKAIRKMIFCNYMFQGVLLFIETVIIRPLVPLALFVFIGLFLESEYREKDAILKEMWIYGGLIVLISLILVFYLHHVEYLQRQTGMRIRIACCSLVYRKMLKLNKKSLTESTAGQVVNLLSNDVSRFDIIAVNFHFLWIMPIQAAITTYLLWRQVKVAAFIGLGALILFAVPINSLVAKLTAVLRLKIAQKTDNRVKKMYEIISGIQVIKMYAWEKPFAKVINAERFKEIKVLKWNSYVKGAMLSSFVFIEKFTLFVTVITYVLFGNKITADKVFSMAQFFNLMQLVLAIRFPTAVTYGAETMVTIKRLQDFLMLEKKSDLVIERKEFRSIALRNIHLVWETGTKMFDGVNIQIPHGTLCAVVGAVGEGKSTLLQLLLGELISKSGSLEISGNISYSSQEAWLFASTVRKNILFGQKYDPIRYKNVVKVCALQRDFELLPYGDNTLVGDRGVSLSGGQKARINLARAVYRDADIYLLDDPLSAVDTHVGKHLFEECIVDFLKGKTRILVTHQMQYMKKVDHLIVLNNVNNFFLS